MDIHNPKELTACASRRLKDAPQAPKVVLIYSALMLGLAALVTLANYALQLQINQTGGLSRRNIRAVFSALQTMLPLLQTMVALCLELGYRSCMVRAARGQFLSPQGLRLGFSRFWPLLRLTLLQAALYLAIGFISVYASSVIFLMTPLSNGFMEALTPLMEQAMATDPNALVLDDAAYLALTQTMVPMLVLTLVIFAAAALPLAYRLRMSGYVLIDKPANGAMACMRESRAMIRFHCRDLLRLDLRLWWYYLLSGAVTVLAYGDLILPLFGLTLPGSATVWSFVFYGLYLAAQFALNLLFLNRVETTYALAYDILRPKENPSGGAVLGNIFQM